MEFNLTDQMRERNAKYDAQESIDEKVRHNLSIMNMVNLSIHRKT